MDRDRTHEKENKQCDYSAQVVDVCTTLHGTSICCDFIVRH
jgi:hypothetical protein